ncbi:hypothetical protein PCANC_03446 [Puccinia coronata f. sp. avenae]|uniref:Dicer-like protein 1 n=1 Tax=Puccinia coronata f. sp. avenae TaxID=200324 RepID=A0A2N5W2A4_9BASI|nr:hypothetical protein PCANC_03446 [Puccinia coronata f. sp. avenae]
MDQQPAHASIDPLGSVKVLRLYQAELLEEAKKRNIIIRADTGTGKTLVALELISWTATRTKANLADHQIQAFLVPSRPLVHQQSQCIQSHSPSLRVKAYTGDLQPELWKIDKWHSELNEVDVIVSTPQIFYDLISKGYWKLEDVSLLIFDEAHNCRKNHVYNQIMRSHYHRLAKDPAIRRLPKILGLTASPIWDLKDLEKAENDVKSLQCALAAQICEVKRHTEDVTQHNFKPLEKIAYYEPPPDFQDLSHHPWEQINQLLALHAIHKAILGFQSVYQELGMYAYSLAILEWLKSLLTIGGSKQLASGRLLDPSHQEQIHDVMNHLEPTVNIDDIPADQLSTKVLTLNKLLVDYKEKDDQRDFHCIVFVERRQHAQLLSILLERNAQLKGFIRPVPLTGHGTSHETDLIGIKMDSKTQNKTVEKFRAGEHNLTIATSVAEEGLDFRSCRVVIRFDLITSWKGYIQSRGRARARDSEYIVMLTPGQAHKYLSFCGKEEQVKIALYDRPEDERIEEGEVESTPQLICRLADGRDSILTYNAATSLLNDVCQLVPLDEFLPAAAPDYTMMCLGESFQCEVTLPPMAALDPSRRTFIGLEMPTKKDAKRSAAFEACKVLRELGVLNEHFLPEREDKSGPPRDADGRELETTPLSDQVEAIVPNVYGDYRTSVEIWLHPLSFPDDSSAGHSTIGFLCGRQLRIPEGLELYDHSLVDSRPLPIKIGQSRLMNWANNDASSNLKRLENFTLAVVQAAVNRKPYSGKLYFLVAPLLEDTCEIDWSLVDAPLLPLSDTADALRHSYIVVPMRNLSHRIFDRCESSGNLSVTSPTSSVPATPSMRDFCKKIAKFRSLGHFYKVVYDLPDEHLQGGGELVYLETTFQVSNNLSKSESQSGQPYRLLLPLSICKQTRIPRSLWKVFSYLPSLTRLLHDGLQTTFLFKRLELPTSAALLGIEALTPPGVGVPWDYQTLETVGDAFLKLATSVHIYLSHLRKGEGDMSHVRSKSVDNAYLRRKAVQAHLPGFILSQRFRVDRFRDAQSEDGKELANGNFSRKIPRRVLSDVVEALLGVGFLTGGISAGLKVGTALDLCFGGTSPWSEREFNISFGTAAAKKTLKPSVRAGCEELQRQIGYVFKKPLLLVQALTHRSANSFVTNCYEREEWLGDAVIDMWIIEHAYKRFDQATAEELTLARAKIVSNGSLGFLAIKKLKLHELIMHHSENFQQVCAEAIEAIEPFTKIEQFFSDINNLFVVFDPPKILNDALEAIVGAVFIDSCFHLPTVYRALDRIFEDVTPGLSQLVARDPLSTMLRLRDQYQCTDLRRISTILHEPNPEGEDKEPISTKVCRIEFHGQEIASGRHKSSASVAEQRASLEAIQVLQQGGSAGTPTTESLWSRCQCRDKAASLAASSNSTENKPNPTPKKASKGANRGTGRKSNSGCTKVSGSAGQGNGGNFVGGIEDSDIEELRPTNARIVEKRLMVGVAGDEVIVIEEVVIEEEEELLKGKKNRRKRALRNRRARAAQARLDEEQGAGPTDEALASREDARPASNGKAPDVLNSQAMQPIVIEDEDYDELEDDPPQLSEAAFTSTMSLQKNSSEQTASVERVDQDSNSNRPVETTRNKHSGCLLLHVPHHDLSDQPPRKKSKQHLTSSSSSSSSSPSSSI